VIFNDAFRAMNTDIDVEIETAVPPYGAFLSMKLLFEQQEQRFSRFRSNSLLSQLNGGQEVADPFVARACRMAVDAWECTGGLFNPMVLPALARAGYDRTFDEVSGGAPEPLLVPSPRDCLRMDGDRVRLLLGALDLGGIVKGWTADLAVESLRGEFPDLFVNAGGDVRCAGSAGDGAGWPIEIDNPMGGPVPWTGRLEAAVATSTTLKRRWKTAAGGIAHHLIDPRTGLPAETSLLQVTAFADTAWRAEVWAKAILIGGEPVALAAAGQGVRSMAMGAGGSLSSWG
jgi:thiamine biosynthesis lipoprotein